MVLIAVEEVSQWLKEMRFVQMRIGGGSYNDFCSRVSPSEGSGFVELRLRLRGLLAPLKDIAQTARAIRKPGCKKLFLPQPHIQPSIQALALILAGQLAGRAPASMIEKALTTNGHVPVSCLLMSCKYSM